MKKGFYTGQPLIIKGTGEKVTFIYDDGDTKTPCNVFVKGDDEHREYYEYEELEPSTEFKFSEIIAGLEQDYFEVGTEFTTLGHVRTIKVKQGDNGLYLERFREILFLESKDIFLGSKDINSTWTLVKRKEMTLEEIEAELGYKIKLK